MPTEVPTLPPFIGPEMKVRRAKRHVEMLRNVWANFVASHPIRVRMWESDRGSQHEIVCREPLPDEVPLIIGDTVHNIRSALDLLANDLLRRPDEKAPDVRFPFCRDESDFGEMERRARFHRAPADLRAMIKALRPWEGKLRAIHELDIVDKHRMIIPTFAFANAEEYGFGAGFSSQGGGVKMGIRIAGGSDPTWVEVDAIAAEDAANSSVALVFSFPDLGQAEDAQVEVPVALEQHADLVERIIQTFKAYCLGG